MNNIPTKYTIVHQVKIRFQVSLQMPLSLSLGLDANSISYQQTTLTEVMIGAL